MNVQCLLRRFLMLAAISLLFSGCGNTDTKDQKAAAQQEQEIIAQLQKRLDAEAEASRANAMQSAINQAAIYQYSGPLRSLPIWDNVKLQVGQEAIKKSGLAPGWQAWVFLGMLYIAAAGAFFGGFVAGVAVVRKIRIIYAQKRLRRLEEKMATMTMKLQEIDQRLAAARQKVEAEEQRVQRLHSEIEGEKEKIRAEYQQANNGNEN